MESHTRGRENNSECILIFKWSIHNIFIARYPFRLPEFKIHASFCRAYQTHHIVPSKPLLIYLIVMVPQVQPHKWGHFSIYNPHQRSSLFIESGTQVFASPCQMDCSLGYSIPPPMDRCQRREGTVPGTVPTRYRTKRVLLFVIIVTLHCHWSDTHSNTERHSQMQHFLIFVEWPCKRLGTRYRLVPTVYRVRGCRVKKSLECSSCSLVLKLR